MTATTTAVPSTEQARTQAAPPSLLTLVRVELRKSADTRAGRWLLIAMVLVTLGVVALQMFFAEGPDRTFASYLANAMLPIVILLPVLGILLVTSEWSQRSAMTTFTLVPRRWRVLLAKVLAAVVLAVLGVLAAAVAAALVAFLTPVLTDGSTDWDLTASHAGQVLVVAGIVVVSGVGFGMLLLSSPLAIVLFFVLPTVFTVLVTTVPALDWVSEWLDLTTATAPMYVGELDADGWVRVATSTTLWAVVPLVLGWLRIERTEIS